MRAPAACENGALHGSTCVHQSCKWSGVPGYAHLPLVPNRPWPGDWGALLKGILNGSRKGNEVEDYKHEDDDLDEGDRDYPPLEAKSPRFCLYL